MPEPTIVFTAGSFDALHFGHIALLRRARALGDRLVVAINHDAYLARKGPGRPLDDLMMRTGKLYATGLVDWVIRIEDSPLELILDLKPDVIVAGDDYTVESCVGSAECQAWNGRVVILPRTPGISTTDLIRTPHDNHALTEGSS